MSKKTWSLLLTGVLLASLFQLGTASAAAPEVPEEPNIVDPQGDANHHSWATGVGSGPYFTGADILAIWFTHDTDNLYMHIQTSTGARPDSLTFITYVDPGVGDDCLQLRLTTEGELNDAFTSVNRSGDCGDGTEEAGEVTEDVGPEDTSILTGIFPRAAGDEFADGNTLAGPNALVGHNAHAVSPRVGIIDDTEVGTDYEIQSEEPEPDPTMGPPPKNDPPKKDKKKNCKKIKNKKKKKKCKKQNKNKPSGCETFEPGERGAEAPLLEIDDSATEEAPLEQTVTLDESLSDVNPGPLPAPFEATTDVFNVQIKTEKEDVGLYALFEFPTRRDYDIDMFHTDGSYAARARGFNTAAETGLFSPGHGGEYGHNYEKLLGIRTSNCGGWTMEASNHLGEGGEFTIKLWLGEPETDPLPPGEETP